MKRKTILTLGAVLAAAALGAVAIPAIARGGVGGHCGPGAALGMSDGPRGPAMMMQRMRGGWGDHGAFGRMGDMANKPFFMSFDADGDGAITADEATAGIETLRAKHDANGDGSLSEEEFAALFAEATRDFAKRPFTMLDADKDGRLSAEELQFPVQMMARMQLRHGGSGKTGAPTQNR